MIGKSVGRFRVLEKLGQGGMATVWRAQDELQGRTVALKLLREEVAEQPGARLRFGHEAKTASLLDHPSIAAVYDWGEFEGRLYLAMTYVDGETVSKLAKSRLLPIEECLRIVESAADALGHAHERGVIHRDVTARNIMVAKDGRVYVLDFGIALVADLTRLTTTGKVFGTAAYIAPEILLHEVASPRSDLYSLGVVLFEALTGRVPFEGERSEVLAFEALRRPAPPPSRLRPAIPAAVDELAGHLLAAEPGDRLQSAKALREAIRSVVDGLRREPHDGASAPPRAPEPKLSAAQPDDPWGPAGPLYLGLLPIRCEPGSEAEGSASTLRQLGEAAAAAVAVPNRVHVVRLSAVASDPELSALREFGRQHGVNALLLSQLRWADGSLRLSYHIVHTESGVEIGGDRIAGSASLPFALEDAFVRSLRARLGDAAPPRLAPGVPVDSQGAVEDRYLQALGYLKRFDNEASVNGAIEILTDLTQRSPREARFHATLARAYACKHALTRQRSWEAQAESACDVALRLDPAAPEVALARGEVELMGGRWESAITAFDEFLQSHPESTEGRIGRARGYEGLGDLGLADSENRRTVQENRDDWRAHHAMAMTHFRHGRYEDAAESWQSVVRLTPDNAGAHRNLGSALFHLDRFDDAEAAFRRSIEMRPDAMAYSNLGTVLFFQERYEESVLCFRHATDLNPADAMSWGNLGNACRFAGESVEQIDWALRRAVGLMRDRLERNPEFGEGWAFLADWQLGLGDQERSLAALKKALSLAPTEARCHWVAAQVYAQLGDRSETLAYLGRAVEYGYRMGSLRRNPYFAAYREDPAFLELFGRSPVAPRSRTKGRSEGKAGTKRMSARKHDSVAKGGRI